MKLLVKELIPRIIAGNHGAFEEFYDLTKTHIYRTIYFRSTGERITGIARLNGGKRLIMLTDFQEMTNAQWRENLKGEAVSPLLA